LRELSRKAVLTAYSTYCVISDFSVDTLCMILIVLWCTVRNLWCFAWLGYYGFRDCQLCCI